MSVRQWQSARGWPTMLLALGAIAPFFATDIATARLPAILTIESPDTPDVSGHAWPSAMHHADFSPEDGEVIEAAGVSEQPELRTSWKPPADGPAEPGGPWVPPDGVPAPTAEEDGVPNLAITSLQIVDTNGNPINPTAGKKFWVRVNYSYTNPVCTDYTIRRVANGWENDAPPINWGCGLGGVTFWWHYWGSWVMHHGGTYATTVTLDAENAIAESNETDNTMSLNFTVSGDVTAEWSLVKVELGQQLLGDGTDVIVGTMDDAFDFNHPWFAGVDSLGRPRLVASSQNTDSVEDSPVNANHATAVMGIVLARGENDGDITGLAPDARYVTAEFINRADIPNLPVLHVLDAAGFLVENGAEVINMSWSWWFGSRSDSQSGEGSVTNLMADYLAYGENIVCVAAVNQLPNHDAPTAPGAARNVLTVGGLKNNLIEAWEQQDYGPTIDGRSKPDLLGNDSANAVATNPYWRNGFPAWEGYAGTSFAAPFVTGAVAQMIDFGKHNGQNTDHRVIKAVVMNSAIKALDDDGSPWSNTPTQPLDDQQGTGILDLARVYAMYSAGEQAPESAEVPGYDFAEVTSTVGPPESGIVVYKLGTLCNTSGFDITLVWDRHTFWEDVNGNDVIDASDFFFKSETDQQDNLDLVLYRDGVEVAASRSVVDNIEHIALTNLVPGEYELHVERLPVTDSGDSEEFAIAWYVEGGLDLDDLASLVACLGGPAGGVDKGCDPVDFNRDGNVDLIDVALFQRAFSCSD